MPNAITEELHVIVQTASFTPLSSAAKSELVQAISSAVAMYGARRNFVVGTVAIQTEARK